MAPFVGVHCCRCALLSVCTAVGVHCSVGVHYYGRVMASQDTNPLKTILFAAADGIGHAAQTTRRRLVASIPGQNPSRGRGQAAWDARVASPRADTEASARGGRIAAQLADYLDKDPQRHAPVVTTTGGHVDPSGCSESYYSLSALPEPVLAPPSLGVFDGPDGEGLEFVNEAA